LFPTLLPHAAQTCNAIGQETYLGTVKGHVRLKLRVAQPFQRNDRILISITFWTSWLDVNARNIWSCHSKYELSLTNNWIGSDRTAIPLL
jgi:hypothetical protein